jgi:hypothetical protein
MLSHRGQHPPIGQHARPPSTLPRSRLADARPRFVSYRRFMRERQAQIISTLSVQPEIDPAKEVEARVAFLRDYLGSSQNLFQIVR